MTPVCMPASWHLSLQSAIDLRRAAVRACVCVSEGAEAIAAALTHNRSITSLKLSYNDIKERGSLALAAAFRVNDVIQSYDGLDNTLSLKSAEAMGFALSRHKLRSSKIDTLKLGANGIGVDGCKRFFASLMSPDPSSPNAAVYAGTVSPKSPLASSAKGGASTATATATVTAASSSSSADMKTSIPVLQRSISGSASLIALTNLDLSENNFGSKACKYVSAFLRSPFGNGLLRLHLMSNKIDVDGCVHLAEALKENRSLLQLALLSNQIGDKGCRKLCAVLMPPIDQKSTSATATTAAAGMMTAYNRTLTSLQLQYNRIELSGGIALLEMMKANRSIVNLSLGGNMMNGGKDGGKEKDPSSEIKELVDGNFVCSLHFLPS